jgi:tetratricopeptide (TPR) repeat protein/predicted Ser/Thr protein kinase
LCGRGPPRDNATTAEGRGEPRLVETTDDIETRIGAAPADEPLLRNPPEWKGRRVGRYLVLDELGSGGMGEVYLAYDPQLDRRVALKLLRRDRGASAEAQDRLLREAQALAKLSHPNVVSVHDVGTVEDVAAGIERTVYVAMEYVEGATLRAWARERSWREIVAAYRAAGAGLAAAHRQGIVHRDFKPTNVIVGHDGRARVLDFGLARRVGEPLLVDADLDESLDRSPDVVSGDGGRSLARSSLDLHLTQTGLVLGTPAYMAPEQFAGEEVDRRGDLFSFCVALWEALYGQRPFAGDDPAQIVRAVRAGRIREPGRNPGEPGRLRAIVRRGLAAKPADRPPDMDTLLAELDRVARPLPRGALALGAAVLAAAGIIALGPGGGAAPAIDPCAGARDQLAGVWDGARKNDIAAAFGKTAPSYATEASASVTRTLDAWTDAWVDARTDACVATRVRGDQSEELMDLRIACLDHRRTELQALVDVFAAADADVVRNAVQGAMSLRPVEACADRQYLRAAVRPPEDPAVAETVARLQEQRAAAHALVAAGKYAQAIEATDAVLDAARPLGYDPLVAEVALVAAEAAERASRIDQVRPLLEEALLAASRCGHARAEAEALTGISGFLGYREANLTEARRYARHAKAVAVRLGNPPELLAGITVREANAEVRAGRPDAAVPLFERVLAMPSSSVLLRRQQQIAALNLSAAHGAAGNYEEADAALTAAIGRLREDLGPRHPNYGVALMNLGATEWKLGELDEALAHLDEAESVIEGALGERSVEMGQALHNRGVVLRERGETEAALEAYERALVIKREVLGPENPSVALTSNNVGSILYELQRHDEAEGYLVRAIEIMEKTLGREHPEIGYAMSTLGLVRLARGQTDEAIALFEEAIEVRAGVSGADETTGEARIGLARALAKTGRDLPRARELARQAHELFLSDPNASKRRRDEAAALVRELGE